MSRNQNNSVLLIVGIVFCVLFFISSILILVDNILSYSFDVHQNIHEWVSISVYEQQLKWDIHYNELAILFAAVTFVIEVILLIKWPKKCK